MRTLLLALLLLLSLPLFAAPAPSFLIWENKPMVQWRVIAVPMEVSVVMDANGETGFYRMIGGSGGLSLSQARKDGLQRTRDFYEFVIFPAYPDVLYLSCDYLSRNGLAVSYIDAVRDELVLFNTHNGTAVELTGRETPGALPAPPADEQISSSPPMPWDTKALDAVLRRHPQMLASLGSRLLDRAAVNGDIPALTLLLDAGVPPGQARIANIPMETSALSHAIGYGHPDAARLLLSRGAAFDAGDFVAATETGDLALVQTFIDHHADVNAADDMGTTPLHAAAKSWNLEMAKLLVAQGADVNARDASQKTPLLQAFDVDAGMWEDLLLIAPPDKLRAMVEYLLAAGADGNAIDDGEGESEGKSAIDRAVWYVDATLYQALLQRGATLDKRHAGQLLVELMDRAEMLEGLRATMVELRAAAAEEGVTTPPGEEDCAEEKWRTDLPALFADLRKRGAEVNFVQEYGWTPLGRAVCLKDLSYARQLIDAGAQVNPRKKGAEVPLDCATEALSLPAVELLIARGARVNAGSAIISMLLRIGMPSLEERTERHDAVLAIATLVLQHNNDLSSARAEEWGGQALHHAADFGYADLVALLLDHGADIDAGDNDDTTALGIAASAGAVETMELLLIRGAKLNARDKLGNTPLHYVMRSGNTAALTLLLNQPGLRVVSNNEGESPLMLFVYDAGESSRGAFANQYHEQESGGITSDEQECVFAATLLQRGCKLGDVDNNGRSVLHKAALGGRTALARFFIAQGATVDLADKEDGNTPLHLTSSTSNVEMVTLLLDHGANVDAKNKAGLTPLDISSRYQNREVTALLIARGGKASKYKPPTD